MTVQETVFSACFAAKAGGAVSVSRATDATFDNVKLLRSRSDIGGALFVDTSSAVHLHNSQVIQCAADSQAGGIFLTDGVIGQVIGGRLSDCVARFGGAMFVAV